MLYLIPDKIDPNCKNCLNANNNLQQQIIDQNIWPRPRWVPQNPTAYESYDPYNRYWMNNVPQDTREDFGNVYSRTDNLLHLILFMNYKEV